MAGIPGQGINNPEGFTDLTDPAGLITINLPSLSGTQSIPLAVLPFWRNDGGIRSFGGARYISVFEDGVTEGTTTDNIIAITEQPIDQTGTFELPNPDPQRLYNVRVRLRSAQGDPNFKDYVLAFRVVSPLDVPIDFTLYDNADIPQVDFDGVANFTFLTTPAAAEIRLRTDGDGILLPTVAAVPFGPAAQAFLLEQLHRQRNGIFSIDFLANGSVEATTRQIYFFKWTGTDYFITTFRRKDFPGWDQYSGTDFGIAQAIIEQGIDNPETFTGPTAIALVLEGATPRFMNGLAWDKINKILYGCTGDGGNNIFTIDVETGAATRIGTPAGLPGAPLALVYDSVNKKLYGTVVDTSGALFEINVNDNTWTVVPSGLDALPGGVGSYRTLAYNRQDEIIYVARDVGTKSALYKLDPKDNFSLTTASGFTINKIVGMDYREDAVGDLKLYMVDDSGPQNLYKMHRNTGGQVLLAAYDALSDVQDLAFDVDTSKLYSVFDNTINPNFHVSTFNPGQRATLNFVNNLYSTGPRFESLIVAGKLGMIDINPKLTIVGGEIDISSVVDFGNNRFLQRFGQDDQYVMLVGVTDTQVVVRQIPLWDRLLTLYAVGGQRAIADLDAPPTFLINSRLVTWPFIEFPNFLDFYDPAPAAPQPFPNLENIKLINQAGVTVKTWVDEADLWLTLVSMRLPDAGTSIPVFDVRSLLTATDSFYVIEADVKVDATTTLDYTIKQTHPLNVDGEPLMWERPDLDVIEELPTFVFNAPGVLTITTPVVWGGGFFILQGDVGVGSLVGPQAANTTVDYDMTFQLTRVANYVHVGWTASTSNFVQVTVPVATQKLQLEGSNTINAFFDGNTIMFPAGRLNEVAVDGLGNKNVVLEGDVGTIRLANVSEGAVYRLGLFGKGSRLFAKSSTSHVTLHFNGTTDKSAVRVPNTFYEFRELQQPAGTLAIKNRGGPSSRGLASSIFRFSMPRLKFLSATNEIEFENDGSLAAYNTARVTIFNPKTFRKRLINGSLLLGVALQLGDAGRDLAVGDHIVVVAAHFNGQVTMVGYTLTAEFSAALKMTPEGYL